MEGWKGALMAGHCIRATWFRLGKSRVSHRRGFLACILNDKQFARK